jgi:hypothetical protein
MLQVEPSTAGVQMQVKEALQTFLNTDTRGWTVLTVHCPSCNLSAQQAADLRKLKQAQQNDALATMDQSVRRHFRKSWPQCDHAQVAEMH